jgi:hypothetical protein
MEKFYIQIIGVQDGPFTIAQLKNENIHSQTPVWHYGLSEWTTASKIDALKPLLLGTGSPPPYNNPEPPKFRSSTPENTGMKKSFILSDFQWTVIGLAFFITAFLYFSNQGAASLNSYNSKSIYHTEIVDGIALIDSSEVEQQRLNEVITTENLNYKNNWNRYIKVAAGDYKYSTLGGIYNLEAVIRNNTDYPLDEVRVTVNYIKDSGAKYKSEFVTIYNVPKNGSASMPAPYSNRGTSVTFEINNIISKKMHFFFSDRLNVDGKQDPYFSRI